MTREQASYIEGRWNGRLLRDWLPDVVADVVRAVDPARIIVFGSVARGEERGESDLDLLVVLDELEPTNRRGLMGRIRSAIDAPIPVDILVAGVEEYEARREVNGSPYYWPARDGRLVYERSAA